MPGVEEPLDGASQTMVEFLPGRVVELAAVVSLQDHLAQIDAVLTQVLGQAARDQFGAGDGASAGVGQDWAPTESSRRVY